MSVEIKVPELGESVVEATVARWLVQTGDPVKAGDPLVELETDKVDLEIPAQTDGVMGSITVEAGADVSIGDVLGTIEAGEAASAGKGPAASTAQAQTAQAQADQPKPEEAGEKVTPVARRMAAEQGIDLGQVSGSGVGGRVTKEDVTRHAQGKGSQESSPAAAPSPAAGQAETSPSPAIQALFARPNGEREERVKMSRRRRTIAQRLVQAQQTAAMLTTFNEVDMSAVMALRARRKEGFEKATGARLGFMSFFAKASVAALKAFPQLNAEIDGDEMVLKRYYDIGIAVGAEEGLVVPVLREVDRLSFAEIENQIRALAVKARDGNLALADLQGGSFTITNGGVFGSMLSTPILNPPQVGILGLHNIVERPVAVAGEVVIRPIMYVALSYDHRIVDGREAVQFLVRIKELIEEPERLLLEG